MANDEILCRVDPVLASVYVSVGVLSITYKVGLYRGRLTTISCLAFIRSSTCLTALRYDCTPVESVPISTVEEEAVSTTAPAYS